MALLDPRIKEKVRTFLAAHRRRIQPAAAIAACLVVLSLVLCGNDPDLVLSLARIESSSARGNGKAPLAFDGKKDTGWRPAGERGGRYEWLRVDFGREVKVSALKLMNGLPTVDKYQGELYDKYSRLKAVRIVFSDNASFYWTLKDNTAAFQTLTLPDSRRTTSVTIHVHSLFKGTLYGEELVVPEIRILGKE